MGASGRSSLLLVGVLSVLAPFASAARSEAQFAATLTAVEGSGSPATGQFTAVLSDDRNSIQYELQYEGITSVVLSSFIDLSLPNMPRSITIPLCGTIQRTRGGPATGPTTIPGGVQECPQAFGTVTGTITATTILANGSDYLTLLLQLLAQNRGSLSSVILATEQGKADVVVQTQALLEGELRGKIVRVTTP